jgi:hypothetical protein
MKKAVIGILVLVVVVCIGGRLSSQAAKKEVKPSTSAASADAGRLITLTPPYVISTLPHFAVWVQFPQADAIRRIALGDSSYFEIEADKNDTHFAVVKQIIVPNHGVPQKIETNMLVYMASGRVIDITLRSGSMQQRAYRIDYPLAGEKPALRASVSTPVEPSHAAKNLVPERTSELLKDRLIEEMKTPSGKGRAVAEAGLASHLYRVKRLNRLAFVSFDVENASSKVIDLEPPVLNLVTLRRRGKLRKKMVVLNAEPIPLSGAWLAPRQLRPRDRALGVVDFKPPAHDANQQIVLDIVNRAMADKPVEIRIE